MALGSERRRLEPLPMPLLTWSIYLADAPAKWLGTVEAATADGAIEVAAKKFGRERERLIMVTA